MTAERHACGIGAFLPMSCRGRAEAFARRLQTRLQHLGATPGGDGDDPENEESWLTNQSSRYPPPTLHQPRLSSSSESDIFFDFDVDLESAGSASPQEEATEEILLNRGGHHTCCSHSGSGGSGSNNNSTSKEDSESGCVSGMTAQSPGSDSSDGNYYDPDPAECPALSPLSTLAEECDDGGGGGEAAARTCNGHADCDNRADADDGIHGAISEGVKEVESRVGEKDPVAATSREKETGRSDDVLTDGVVDDVECAALGGRKSEAGYSRCNGGECEGGGGCGEGIGHRDCGEQVGESFCSTFLHSRECVVECPASDGMGVFLSKHSCVPEKEKEEATATATTLDRLGEGHDEERGDINSHTCADPGDGCACKENGKVEEISEEVRTGMQKNELSCLVEENSEEKVANTEIVEESCKVAEGETNVPTEECERDDCGKIEAIYTLEKGESLIINQEYELSDTEYAIGMQCKREEESNVDITESETSMKENPEGNDTDLRSATETERLEEEVRSTAEETIEVNDTEKTAETSTVEAEETKEVNDTEKTAETSTAEAEESKEVNDTEKTAETSTVEAEETKEVNNTEKTVETSTVEVEETKEVNDTEITAVSSTVQAEETKEVNDTEKTAETSTVEAEESKEEEFVEELFAMCCKIEVSLSAAHDCPAHDVETVDEICQTEDQELKPSECCLADEICQTEEGELVLLVSECDKPCRSTDETCQTEEEELKLLIQECEKGALPKAHSPNGISDDDDDECRPRRVQRCSSLKTGKTPPGTPGRKKIVRFADVLGLDLADVRTFLDEIPKIPTSAYEDLPNADLTLGNSTSTPRPSANHLPLCSMPKADRSLMPLFQQPGGCPDFLDRVRHQYVCLENAMVKDMVNCTITGTVRVLNLDFYKSVHIRYSLDCWATYADLQATYVANSCDGFSDTFSFVLYGNSLKIGQRLEFAVRFQCHGNQHWDSNHGMNYVFQCLPPPGPAPSLSLPCEGDRWASFY